MNALGQCHPECRFCAREWWDWLGRRMKQFKYPKRGDTVSFLDAAATSIKADP